MYCIYCSYIVALVWLVAVFKTPLSSQEKRRTKKALELKKEAEWKLEVVQREAHQLASQVTTARAQLKLSRKQTH